MQDNRKLRCSEDEWTPRTNAMMESVSIIMFMFKRHTNTHKFLISFFICDAHTVLTHSDKMYVSTSTCTPESCSFCLPRATLVGAGNYGVNLFLLESARSSLITPHMYNSGHTAGSRQTVLSCVAYFLWPLLSENDVFQCQPDSGLLSGTLSRCLMHVPQLFAFSIPASKHTTAGFQF